MKVVGFLFHCHFNNAFVIMYAKSTPCISLIVKVNPELLEGRKHDFLIFKNMPNPLKTLPILTVQEISIK